MLLANPLYSIQKAACRVGDGYRVLVLDGDWPNTAHVRRALEEVAGVDVHVVKRAAGSVEGQLEAIAHAAHRCGADVVLPTSLESVHLLSEHGASLAPLLPLECRIAAVPSFSALREVIDKGAFASFVALHGLAAPATQEAAARSREEKLRFPLLIKPKVGFAGAGIRRIRNADELARATADPSFNPDAHIFQELVPGYDVDCCVLCRDGELLAATVQRCRLATFRFGPPALIQFVQRADILNLARDLMKALSWSGVAHIDIRHDSRTSKPLLLEVNARYWASLPGSIAAGVNFPHLACLDALDLRHSQPTPSAHHAYGWFACPRPDELALMPTPPRLARSLATLVMGPTGTARPVWNALRTRGRITASALGLPFSQPKNRRSGALGG